MRMAVSDGNGGLYIRRTLVEKAMLGIASLFLAFMSWVGLEVYRELRSQNVQLLRLEIQMQNLVEHTHENANKTKSVEEALKEHDRWGRDQRERLDKRIDSLERRR